MHPLIHSAIHHDALISWLAMIGFGAYHGLNPGMGWLFSLSRGLQLQSERAVWSSLIPIALGHGAAVTVVAALVLAAGHLMDPAVLRVVTAATLLAFGVYKLFRYYRHPLWVGMQVGMRDLFFWSFLMASAHGAGVMVAPVLLSLTRPHGLHTAAEEEITSAVVMLLAISVHTAAMLGVMGLVAWVVYKKLGLAVLRKGWLNFDLLWAGALLAVGVVALFGALSGGGHH
ncbi:hypothetical protein LPW11_04455 [Geomonas sp. RF6]|uniref:hypothetical protein n=1 Tax=Geomonas sp. RF6 TaxID=2897342 RepID=UPI001E302D9D|nr:hypothetical protein [Geomonas sp. RF6]UFS71451.1 hypothetical protein LPW11_04455 [Geomonas sp. RF6]